VLKKRPPEPSSKTYASAAFDFVVILVAVLAAAGLAACTSTSANPISVMVSPASASVPAGQTAQFTATVNNTSNPAVTWRVNGVAGGNSTVGTISTSGLYTAPATVPSPAPVTVTAVSQADTSRSGSAAVTITPAQPVSVSPSSVTVPAGMTRQFTAAQGGMPLTQVTWQVDGVAGGNATFGTISASGLYTAPLTPPPGGTATISAVSQAAGGGSGSATATIGFSNASLQGSYAFSFTGTNAGGFLTVGGIVVSDGKGNIPSGVEDVNSAAGVFTNLAINPGTYSVGLDGRGTATLNTSLGAQTLRFALSSNQHAFIIRFDTFATAGGTMDLQDPAGFSLTALAGSHAFSFSGIDRFGNRLDLAGQFTADGSGSITTGTLDANDNGILSSSLLLSGTYTVASNGRGTALISSALGTQSFAFYVVTAADLKLVEIDIAPVVSGEVLGQQGGPTFSNASLQGNFAFALGGLSGSRAFASGGIFTADGNGNITGGLQDINNNGSLSQNLTLSGSYTISPSGRGTLTLTSTASAFQFVLYAGSSGIFELLEIDGNAVSSGFAQAQKSGTFSNASLQGSFALNLGGVTSAGEEDISGSISANGSGALAGALDVNNNGSLFPNLALSGGSYTLNSSIGRGAATLQTPSGNFALNLYLINNSTALLLDVDSSRVLLGVTAKQF